jgi:hypothetical protein
MGLGITRLSLVTVIADDCGETSVDSQVKIRRMINRRGAQFCLITDWPFTHSDLSFTITHSAYQYSGASYLPTTFKKVVAAYLMDGTTKHPLKEVTIKKSYEWDNPNENEGIPEEFCITRMESGYYEIAFDRLPDQDYVVYLEIELQWVDLTEDTSETLITKEYFDAFAHFCSMGMLKQQGDLEQYAVFKDDWYNPLNPRQSILGQILATLKKPLQENKVVMDPDYVDPLGRKEDYPLRGADVSA